MTFAYIVINLQFIASIFFSNIRTIRFSLYSGNLTFNFVSLDFSLLTHSFTY